MEMTDKDWEWFNYPALKRRILQTADEEAEEEAALASQESDGLPAARKPKPTPPRIAKKLTDSNGNLHFHDPAVQQD